MENQKVIVFGVDGLIPNLVYKFAEEGNLPNIKEMMNSGATTELLPFISTWGDVNWVSFLTGQSPGCSWKGQSEPGTNEGNVLGLTNSLGKRGALVHFPKTVSTEGTNHFSFAPFQGAPPFELASPRVFSTDMNKWPLKETKESLGWPPTSAISHHEKNNLSSIEINNGHYLFNLQLNNGEKLGVSIQLLDDQCIRLHVNEDTEVDIEAEAWSEWLKVQLDNKVEGIVRFKLAKYDRSKGEIDIIQSQINRTSGLSNDSKLEEYLLANCGPFISTWTVKASPDELYHETSFEEGEYQAMWLANAALKLVNHKDIDYFATVYRLNDETHHTSLSQYDPSSPFYSEELSYIYEENMRKSYEVLDRAIGKILSEKMDDTTLILASDHGGVPNHYFCDIYLRLEECGLCELDDKGMPVLSKSKAYLKNNRGGLEVFVNLKGREETGIVAPEDYEMVKSDIFHAIVTWVNNVRGKSENVSALTLKKQDAPIIGYWGPEMGDVIFTYNQGYVWGTNKKDVIGPVSEPGANHGPQITSARTSHSSNLGIFISHGKYLKKGYQYNTDKFGPYLMSDAGKTIFDLLASTESPSIDGRFMSQLFISER